MIVQGRRCDRVEDFFYTGPLDYLLFEAEYALGSDKPPTLVIKRKPNPGIGETTWTGDGFMQVFEGSTLTFRVPEIFRTMNYFPVIRFEQDPSHPVTWEHVDVELIRHDATSDDFCSTDNDNQIISLPSGESNVQLYEPFCLEKNQRYEIKLTFTQYNPNEPKGAKILIDAVSIFQKC